MTGLEPATFRSTGDRSSLLSYTPKIWHLLSFQGSDGLMLDLVLPLHLSYYIYNTRTTECQPHTTSFF
jgi:hypothetical protein